MSFELYILISAHDDSDHLCLGWTDFRDRQRHRMSARHKTNDNHELLYERCEEDFPAGGSAWMNSTNFKKAVAIGMIKKSNVDEMVRILRKEPVSRSEAETIETGFDCHVWVWGAVHELVKGGILHWRDIQGESIQLRDTCIAAWVEDKYLAGRGPFAWVWQTFTWDDETPYGGDPDI